MKTKVFGRPADSKVFKKIYKLFKSLFEHELHE